jgi:serine/threonine protein kinase
MRIACAVYLLDNPKSWKWEKCSERHEEKFMELRKHGQDYPEQVKEVGGVRVCCSKNFLIGRGSEGTRVYIGLGKDGYERAVKRLPKDALASLAEQEKKVLNDLGAMKSNHVINYWSYDDESDDEHLYLILDLCEETLEEFVGRSSLDDLKKVVPDITRQVLEGFADLHGGPMPTLHRDVKPSNILRNVHGKWLLADFGLARILMESVTTHASKQRGTVYWRAVETYPRKGMPDDSNVRYKKESDIQVGFS